MYWFAWWVFVFYCVFVFCWVGGWLFFVGSMAVLRGVVWVLFALAVGVVVAVATVLVIVLVVGVGVIDFCLRYAGG